MGWFSRKSKKTALHAFVNDISIGALASAPGSRYGTVAATLILQRACASAELFRKQVAKLKGAEPLTDAEIDSIAFEYAAYSHYQVMSDFLTPGQIRDHEPIDDPINSAFQSALIQSSVITEGIFDEYSDTQIVENLLFARCLQLASGDDLPAAQLATSIASSVANGSPLLTSSVSFHDSLPIQLLATTSVPIFESTIIPFLRTGIRRGFDHHRKTS